jgi:hypothetical protein
MPGASHAGACFVERMMSAEGERVNWAPRMRALARDAALPLIVAHPLKERHKPFDGPKWLFEMK